MDKLLHEFVALATAFLLSLLPPALGAIVSMMVETGLTWRRMLVQLWVGVVVSYFTVRAIDAVFTIHPFVSQAIGFLVGMVAYKAAPGFISGCSTALAELPGLLRDRLLALIPRKETK